jgi:protoporphyrin/coproporphyrin ferrochelatase
MSLKSPATIGVLVMAYGGPDNLDEVEPYLLDVRGYRPTAPALLHEVRARYREIGGRSPILERTQAQAAALEGALNSEAAGFKTFVGMRHWRPYIKESLARMVSAGISQAVGLVMAPHYSRLSIGAYYQKADEAAAPVELARIERWNLLPGYLVALADHVRAGLGRFPADVRARVPIIFTAHSLPQRILEWNDPYPAELRATVEAVIERLGPHPHYFAYQSAAMTPDPWLGPDAGAVVAELAGAGHRHMLLAPIGFVCEHVEILYDVDVVFRRQAQALGVQLERIEMLNTNLTLIAGLAQLVQRTAAEAGWR